jgi:Mn2+/Fe2+ NRAMP family transporter
MKETSVDKNELIARPPRGLMLLSMVGPGLVWAGEYIGSGEVILCTRLGAIMGTALLWVPMLAIFLKYWIGISGARYTVCVGEGMIDMFGRMPGPGKWAVWIVLIGQFCAGAVSIAALALASGTFIHALLPVNQVVVGWIVSLFCVSVVWSGSFDPLKYIASFLVLIMVIGVIYVTWKVMPGAGAILSGIFGFNLPEVPAWAIDKGVATKNVWAEMLPVLGWAAGGFASQAWYSYWVLESGFGMAATGGFGKPADENLLRKMTTETATRLKGWCKVVYTDATVALMVGTVVTGCFLVAGAGVLGPAHLAPQGAEVALELSELFGSFWGKTGAVMFLMAGSAAMISTNLCQFAGWPRIMSDCLRILFPKRVSSANSRLIYRIFVLFFFFSNMVLINTFGFKPVVLLKLGAILDGVILSPLQAILIAIALYLVMPGMLSEKARKILRPNPTILIGLIISALVFSYFAVVKLPSLL